MPSSDNAKLKIIPPDRLMTAVKIPITKSTRPQIFAFVVPKFDTVMIQIAVQSHNKMI